ncbi:MAG TPA: hypothetical protein VFI80_09610 [Burkholderiales bacterium]|nr:hypothetical protein [Burkholderiales bacterium]
MNFRSAHVGVERLVKDVERHQRVEGLVLERQSLGVAAYGRAGARK